MELFKSPTLVALCLIAPSLPAQESAGGTIDSGIVEQTESRLVQIDVTARGPVETLSALTAANFTLTVGRTDITDFVLDRVCIGDRIRDLKLAAPEQPEIAPTLRTLFFFDQTHLTALGRRRALDLARELIPELLRSGRSEAMIVSAGRRLEVAAEWSSDPVTLLAALEELATETAQVSSWADQEDTRVERMMAAIDRSTEMSKDVMRNAVLGRCQDQAEAIKRGLEHARIFARQTARDLMSEEVSHTAAGLNLFALALRHFDAHAPPKAIVYFADTMRANQGDFYVRLVQAGERVGKVGKSAGDRLVGPVTLSTGNYVREFQDVIDLATEKGVRLYTVQGRGLTPASSARTRMDSASVSTADPAASMARFKDAENALSGLARETGGRSFLGAADATQIASRILDDLSCPFVLSFRADELKEDRATSVWIHVDRPGVELQYRPRLIALSEEARSRVRLAGAFSGAARNRGHARIVAIPTGFEKGKYTLLVQFAIPGSEHSAGDWDMGVTALISRGRTIEASGRVAVNRPRLPLVFEAEMQLKPGDYTINAVARNRDYDEVVSTRVEGSLADPEKEDPFVASTVLVQRIPGAFVRGEETKTSGSLAHGPEHWLRPDRTTAILSLVCGKKGSGPVTAVRRLDGASSVSFDPVDLDFAQERCGLFVDTVEAGTFTSGRFSYAVDLHHGEETREASALEFLVVTPEEVAAARAGSSY